MPSPMHNKIHISGDVMPPLNALIYGPNGAGKTHLAGTSGFLMINVEQGETTLVSAGMKVPVWNITEPDEIWEVYDYLAAGAHKEFAGVAIDSYTDLSAKYLENVVGQAEARDPNRLTDAAELRDHGRVTLKLGKVLRRFRDLPIDLMLICGEREPDDQDRRYRPNLPASVSRQARDYTDIIARLAVVEQKDEEDGEAPPIRERKLLIYSPSGAYVCRDRTGVFTPETGRRGLTNPTWPMLKQFIADNAPHKQNEKREVTAADKPKRPVPKSS